jgi:hypothetical protein
LRDDHIHAGRDSPPGLLGTADGEHDDSPGVVHGLDVAAWIPQHERDDPQAGFEGLVKATMLILGENEVAAERPLGQLRRLAHDGTGVGRPGERHHVERAGIRDRRGQRGNRGHGGRDDRLLHPEHFAYWRAHCLRLP